MKISICSKKAVLISAIVFIGIVVFSIIHIYKVQGANLSQIEYVNNYTVESNMAQQIGDSVNSIRTRYGLTALTKDGVLPESALYEALYLLQYDQSTYTDTYTAGPLKGSSISQLCSFINGRSGIILRLTPGLDSQDAVDYIIRNWENNPVSAEYFTGTNFKSFGVSVVSTKVDGNKVYYAVIHLSKAASVSYGEANIPPYIMGGDTFPPEIVSSEDIKIPVGGTVTDELLGKALEVKDNTGSECYFTYDTSKVNNAVEGKYEMPVTISDYSGNSINHTMTVEVVGSDVPVILSTKIVLPEFGFSDVYDLSQYVSVSCDIGIKMISCNPMVYYAQSGQELPKEVDVTVISKTGKAVTKTLPVETYQPEYNIAYDEKANLSGNYCITMGISVAKENYINNESHCIINGLYGKMSGGKVVAVEGNYLYRYTFVHQSGLKREIIRHAPDILWDPELVGDYTITLEVLNSSSGISLGKIQVNISVAQKENVMYNIPELGFSEESGIILSDDGQLIIGLTPGITASELLGAVVLSEEENVPEGLFFVKLLPTGSEDPASDEDTVGTGWTLCYMQGSSEVSRHTLIIYGDVNGDGAISIADFAKMRQHLINGNIITGDYMIAGDINYDGSIGIADFSKFRQHMLGNIEISQTP